MSDLAWGILIVLGVVAAILFAWRSFGRESAKFTKLLERVRFRYHGELTPATALAYPQLKFTHNGCEFRVGAMATDGAPSGGPFTFVEVLLPDGRSIPDQVAPPSIKVRITEGRLHLHRDGIAKTREELDEIVNSAINLSGVSSVNG